MSTFRLVTWFCTCLGLALLSRWQVLGARSARCALDGSRIVKTYQVDLVRDGQATRSFCCVRCATEWPERSPPAAWLVRDEVTGQVLDATLACFVESSAVTVPARHDRVHVFKRWPEAMQHIAEHGGARIVNPFDGED